MRFGLFYEHQLPRPWAEGDEQRLLNDALEQIELADRLGFDYVWEVEHHFLEEYSHSSAPEVFLAAASQRTERIRLGHGIVQLPPPINHPARVAERIATLDLLSDGRVDFGTGEGSSQAELAGFGVDREAKREQWREALDVTLRMMTEEPFTGHHGRWVDAPPRNVVPKPRQKPHPPVWMACSRRETIEVAARHGVGALSFSFVEPEDAEQFVEAYYRIIASAQCVPAGLSVNPNVAVVLPFMCHEDEETAIDRGIDGAHFFGYSLAHYYVFGEHRPGRTSIWDEFADYRRERGYARDIISAESGQLGMKVLQEGVGSMRGAVGTPDQIADLVARYDAVGVDQIIFVGQAGRNRHEHVCESLELFADQVLPRFADGREEEEARKRERLADAVAEAVARRAQPEPRRMDEYVITPQGELAPAREARPLRDDLDDRLERGRRRVRAGVRDALGWVVGRVDEQRLEKAASSSATWRIVFGGMERLIDADAARDMDATIRFELQAAGGAHVWTLRIRDGRTSASAAKNGEPDAILRADAADFLRVVTGTLPMGKAVMDERLTIEGDVGVASRLGVLLGAPSVY